MPGHQDARRSYVVARSSRDGYAVVFSWGELYNSEAGDDILVAYQKNGLALDPGEGPLALVSTGDLRSGPRHVKWLDGLEVVRLPRGPLATP
ncbi:putative oxidoreductase, molybdopterin binding protein [Pseudomonas aeruginosa]|nr:putative oxidoreductase, molybdopterin binding protein [Pseudomonas aeruginosa]